MGPPAPPPLRRVEPQPRLIQRMESGYESSERNSSSPDRWGRKISAAAVRGTASPPPHNNKLRLSLCSTLHREVGPQKRALMSGPSWRSVPKSKSSGAILQELPRPGWGGAGAGLWSEHLPPAPPAPLKASPPV